MSELRYTGIGIDHPGARDRLAGAQSTVRLRLATASGRIRDVDLSTQELISLIADAAKVLRIVAPPP